MAKKNGEFLKKLLATFAVEAEEHLAAIAAGLLELEKAPEGERRKSLIETVFREAHSLKGAARAVNLTAIEALCQQAESVFVAMKRGELAPSPPLFDVLHAAVAALKRLAVAGGAASDSGEQSVLDALGRRLEAASKAAPTAKADAGPPMAGPAATEGETAPAGETTEGRPDASPVQAVPPEQPVLADTVRISTAKLDALFRQTEELVSAKLATAARAAQLREFSRALAARRKARETVRSQALGIQTALENCAESGLQGKIRLNLGKLLEFVEQENSALASLESRLAAAAAAAEQDSRVLGKAVDGLLEDAKKVLMLPIASLLDVFPALVRELARDRGKEAQLAVEGADIEIDRRILEEMKDPLIHLVRNCVDHGIEPPAERTRRNKPPCGTIALAVSRTDAGKAAIVVSDDGAGFDTARLRQAAQKLDLISAEEASRLGVEESLALAFRSGVSTSPIVTDLSGRGLGLAIVQEKVERLGGTVFVESRAGAGTTVRLVLPLTLSAFRGVVVRVNERLFVLPATGVERVARVEKEEIKTVENRETIQLNGRALSLARLRSVLGLPARSAQAASPGPEPFVLLAAGGERIAFLVDEVVGEQEVLVRGLGKQLLRVPNVAGAAMLGTGTPAPILSVPDLMKSAVRAAAPARPAAIAEAAETAKRSILVVEDSITARALLQNILEAAGYQVKTAVDGIDALTTLKTGEFDLVVSDVQMPRMDGFDLTARIRADRKLAELPVVLVTALESREDRERGIDVGANAYIVKSSFDQSNLLAVIRKLL
ncbi:MAG: response regulator [Betaproteobacteria bacterium]|nr:response regulator [Betaproteobacteria bacterium]